MLFYLVTNVGRSAPEFLQDVPYIHIKCKTDGSQTAIVSHNPIEGDGLTEMTKEEMKALLDVWIDEENETPDADSQGRVVLQQPIDLDRIMELVNG